MNRPILSIDPGGDIADAIGLGLWWTEQQSLASV